MKRKKNLLLLLVFVLGPPPNLKPPQIRGGGEAANYSLPPPPFYSFLFSIEVVILYPSSPWRKREGCGLVVERGTFLNAVAGLFSHPWEREMKEGKGESFWCSLSLLRFLFLSLSLLTAGSSPFINIPLSSTQVKKRRLLRLSGEFIPFRISPKRFILARNP